MAHLENHEILSSKNLHEMRDILMRLTRSDEVDLIGRRREIDASVRVATLDDLDLLHVTYGDVPTRVRTHEEDERQLMLFVLTGGTATVQDRGGDFQVSPGMGVMRDKRLPLAARQDAFASFVVPLSIDVLERHVRTLVGDDAGAPCIRFDTRLDLTTAGGRHLRSTIEYIANALDGPLRSLDNRIVLTGLRDLLLTTVLTMLPNSCSDVLQDQTSARIVPYYLKRARDYIHGNAAQPITLEALTSHAGCGYRTLQTAFRDVYGMSPMEYLTIVRLTQAHDDLRFAGNGVTVAQVARKWGFTNPGRFAQRYSARFGVLPSHTVRMRR